MGFYNSETDPFEAALKRLQTMGTEYEDIKEDVAWIRETLGYVLEIISDVRPQMACKILGVQKTRMYELVNEHGLTEEREGYSNKIISLPKLMEFKRPKKQIQIKRVTRRKPQKIAA